MAFQGHRNSQMGMQEQLLEKHVHEYPVLSPNLLPHHCFQCCKQQTGISMYFLHASAPFFLSFCSLIASLLLFPRFSLLFPVTLQHILFLHIDTLFLDPLWLLVPLPSVSCLLSAPQLFSSLLSCYPLIVYSELGQLQKVVIWSEIGGVSSKLGVDIGCREKYFPSWR